MKGCRLSKRMHASPNIVYLFMLVIIKVIVLVNSLITDRGYYTGTDAKTYCNKTFEPIHILVCVLSKLKELRFKNCCYYKQYAIQRE